MKQSIPVIRKPKAPSSNPKVLGRIKALVVAQALSLVMAQTALADDGLSVVWLPYPQEGIELGQGYDLLDDRKASAVCIDFFPVEDRGIESTFNISQINSFSETFSKFGVSASGQLSLAILSAKASLQFANSATELTNSERYAITAQVRRGAYFVSPVPGSKPGGTLSLAQEDDSTKPHQPLDPNALSAIRFKKFGITEDNFETSCGSHYVAAILSGIDVKASLTTQQSDSAGKSSFSGSVEIEYAGIFKGGGSIEGANEATRRAYASNVDAYILGGSDYEMPTDVEGLASFIKQATKKQVSFSPRPMMIGLISYKTLGTGSNIDAFEAADTLKPAIFAYFSSREALDRLNLATKHKLDPGSNGLVLNDEIGLFIEKDLAYQSVIAIRTALADCRDLLIKENKKRADNASAKTQAGPGGTPPEVDLQTLYADMVEMAENDRLAAYAVVRERLFSDESAIGRMASKVSIESCLSGLVDQKAVSDAKEIFVRSLAMMPLYVNDLVRDPYISKEALGQAAKIVAETTTADSADLDARLNDLDAKRMACIYDIVSSNEVGLSPRALGIDIGSGDTVVTELRSSAIDLLSPDAITDQVFGAKCNEEYEKKKAEIKSAFTEEQRKERDAYSVVIQAIARHVYRAHFDPIRRSMCGDDLGHQICAMSYPEVTSRIARAISIDQAAAVEVAKALLPEPPNPPPPPPKVTTEGKPSKPKYFPKENCGYGTKKICP